MTIYKTIYSSRDQDFGAHRTATDLHIRVNSDDAEGPVYLDIPNEDIEFLIKNLTDIALAPEWTRAKFIRVLPKTDTATYTMANLGNGTWADEYGQTATQEELLGHNIRIEVIA